MNRVQASCLRGIDPNELEDFDIQHSWTGVSMLQSAISAQQVTHRRASLATRAWTAPVKVTTALNAYHFSSEYVFTVKGGRAS